MNCGIDFACLVRICAKGWTSIFFLTKPNQKGQIFVSWPTGPGPQATLDFYYCVVKCTTSRQHVAKSRRCVNSQKRLGHQTLKWENQSSKPDNFLRLRRLAWFMQYTYLETECSRRNGGIMESGPLWIGGIAHFCTRSMGGGITEYRGQVLSNMLDPPSRS